MENILTSIFTTLDDDPGNPKIQHFQANVSPLWTRIADLTNKIGVGYFSFEYHITLSPSQNKKATPQRLEPLPEQEEEETP